MQKQISASICFSESYRKSKIYLSNHSRFRMNIGTSLDVLDYWEIDEMSYVILTLRAGAPGRHLSKIMDFCGQWSIPFTLLRLVCAHKSDTGSLSLYLQPFSFFLYWLRVSGVLLQDHWSDLVKCFKIQEILVDKTCQWFTFSFFYWG
jgi:hypothetical protein